MHTRRTFLLTAAAAAVQPPARKPNVLVILADDLGSADLGYSGCRDIPTPNLDRLRGQGVRFANSYVSHPFCSPTRAGLLTGRYQQRFGHENNPQYGVGEGLPLSETLLPALLKPAGYTSALIGKWHLGDAPHFHPNARGFDEFYGFLGGGHQYFPLEPPRIDAAKEYFIPLTRNREPVPQREYMTQDLSREAATFIARRKRDPFFLYLAYNAPHTPMQAPPEYLARFASISDERRRQYAAMVSALDDGVGAVLKSLQENSLDNDTLVFFLSDNGGPPQANSSSNLPLRNGKGSLYEGGIRTPMIARWTGRLKPGGAFDAPVTSLDIAATTLALAGAPPAKDRPLDGVDLLPFLTGARSGSPHERLFWRTGGGTHHALREASWKLVLHQDSEPELYDLARDPAERNDIALSNLPRVRELRARLLEWNSQLAKPAWPGLSAIRRP